MYYALRDMVLKNTLIKLCRRFELEPKAGLERVTAAIIIHDEIKENENRQESYDEFWQNKLGITNKKGKQRVLAALKNKALKGDEIKLHEMIIKTTGTLLNKVVGGQGTYWCDPRRQLRKTSEQLKKDAKDRFLEAAKNKQETKSQAEDSRVMPPQFWNETLGLTPYKREIVIKALDEQAQYEPDDDYLEEEQKEQKILQRIMELVKAVPTQNDKPLIAEWKEDLLDEEQLKLMVKFRGLARANYDKEQEAAATTTAAAAADIRNQAAQRRGIFGQRGDSNTAEAKDSGCCKNSCATC